MINVEDIRIVEFRGIRDLEISFGCESYSVWGPNGSGKSGVVDALDFALTGDISRLRGTGSGGVTLLKHGPHVSRRDDPGSAYVEVTVCDTATGDVAKLKRCVRTPGTYTLDPDLATVRASLTRVEQHPELMLSRREIIKYIIAESAKRATEIQALLKLDRLGEIRATFRSAKSKAASSLQASAGAEKSAQQALERHLDLPELLLSEVLFKINAQRAVLGLDPILELGDRTDVTAGLAAPAGRTALDKSSAARDLEAARTRVSDDSLGSIGELRAHVEHLEKDPALLESLATRNLVEVGLPLVVDEHCPLCDRAWNDLAELRVHLEAKRDRSADAARLKTDIDRSAATVASELRSVEKILKPLGQIATSLNLSDEAREFEGWSGRLLARAAAMSNLHEVRETCPVLIADPLCRSGVSAELLEGLATAIDALPDPGATDSARAFLTIAQERLANLRATRSRRAKAAAVDASAEAIYDAFCAALDEGLADLYVKVQGRLSEFYRFINSDDEGEFRASLEPGAQKLDLLVDFHGQGMFPPMAYHSEGHQDGMGVCLYLALMERLLGDQFRFAVLDDVVMSVDVNHRRQFCALLTTYFPEVQFIITTHDEVWARQMQQSALVSKPNQSRFLGWSVETGPVVMEGSDFWDRIDEDLDRHDVSSAAARLRRNVEARLADVAEQLGGMVPYRSSGNWDLGEYVNAVKGRYSKLLGRAAGAANSWNDDVARARVAEVKQDWDSASLGQTSEQWAVNPAVHFNEWANFSESDFRPVVEACRCFLAIFECASCNTQVRLSKVDGREDALRCGCGAFHLNLLGR
jgi:hypothetical protein